MLPAVQRSLGQSLRVSPYNAQQLNRSSRMSSFFFFASSKSSTQTSSSSSSHHYAALDVTRSLSWAPILASRAFTSSAAATRHDGKDNSNKENESMPSPPPKNGKGRRRSSNNSEKSSSSSSSSSDPNKLIRLSKRMSELDICSRREADRFIAEGRVMLNGNLVEPIMGQKVPPNEQDIVLMSQSSNNGNADQKSNSVADVQRRPLEFAWDELQTSAVVLHKPIGYVSGHFEGTREEPTAKPATATATQQHVPAVRLLSPDNAYIVPSNYYDEYDGSVNEAEYQEANNIVDHRLHFELYRASNHTSLQGYVPAGRLDLQSSGLLVFTKHGGVLAKKLISPHGLIEKEYLVVVEPLQGLTRNEREAGMSRTRLPPKPNKNLARLKQGGYHLWGEEHRPPLRPVVAAEWLRFSSSDLAQTYLSVEEDLEPNERRRVLRVVLREGRKHQLRRMCRELLGMHVVKLVRTRVGPIELDSIPEGKWRPLRQQEAEAIYRA